MTRSELIDLLATRMNQLSPKLVEDAIKNLFDRMIVSMASGERIEIRGFGSFELRFRAARKARNPRTGAEVKTEDKRTPHFRPGKEMRERVQNSQHPIHD